MSGLSHTRLGRTERDEWVEDDAVDRAAAALSLVLDAVDPVVGKRLERTGPPLRSHHAGTGAGSHADTVTDTRARVCRALPLAIDSTSTFDVCAHPTAASHDPHWRSITECNHHAQASRLVGDASAWASSLLYAAEAMLLSGLNLRAVALMNDDISTLDASVLHARAGRLRIALDALVTPTEPSAAQLRSVRAREDDAGRRARDIEAPDPPAAFVSEQHALDATATKIGAAAVREDVVPPGDPTGPTLRWLVDEASILETWDAEQYRRHLQSLQGQQRERGELQALRVTLLGLCRSEMCAGRFSSADAYRAEASALSLELDGRGPYADFWNSVGAELLAWQDREAETRAAVAILTSEFTRSIGADSAASIGWHALTILELGRGRYRNALDAARNLLSECGSHPATLVLADLVEAGVRSGDIDTALVALERLTERAHASGTGWTLGLLARCRALIADAQHVEALYREAISHLTRSMVRTDLARCHLLYGEWLRREKRRSDARAQLRTAHAMFSEMGATAFAERARVEQDATSQHARRRSVETASELTPQEQHIARLAAQGDRNAEIAERLYISARTVDYHLRKVYRKLGISSRRQLRGRFS